MNSYAWRLEAAVWTEKHFQTSDEERCRPRLLLVTRQWQEKDEESPVEVVLEQYSIIGFIERDPGSLRDGRAQWLVYHYPPNADNLWALSDQTNDGFREVLGEGENREPRPSAQAALERLLELTHDEIPSREHRALRLTSSSMLTALKTLTEAFVRHRERPAPKLRG